MTSSMHKNGFITHDEFSLVVDGLELLQSQYAVASKNIDNPPALRKIADRRYEECKQLLRAMKDANALRL